MKIYDSPPITAHRGGFFVKTKQGGINETRE